jgi:hypothetical protein
MSSSNRGERVTAAREEFARVASGVPPVCYTIKEFCRAHRLGVSTYYELKKLGLGPREKRIFSRVIITDEAAAEWRARNDNAGDMKE